LDVNFAGFNLTVQSGNGVLIETGGFISEDLIYLKVTPLYQVGQNGK